MDSCGMVRCIERMWPNRRCTGCVHNASRRFTSSASYAHNRKRLDFGVQLKLL